MGITFSDAARQDLAEITAWFEEHTALGGAGFATLIRRTVERIGKMPFASPPWRHAWRFRAWTLEHVHYRIFYEVTDQAIRVVAIAHTDRRPGHWLDRNK